MSGAVVESQAISSVGSTTISLEEAAFSGVLLSIASPMGGIYPASVEEATRFVRNGFDSFWANHHRISYTQYLAWQQWRDDDHPCTGLTTKGRRCTNQARNLAVDPSAFYEYPTASKCSKHAGQEAMRDEYTAEALF